MKQTIIDANYILRWFLNDISDQAEIASKLIQTSKPGTLLIDRVTVAEITYVLRSKLYDHHQIFSLLQELFYYPSIIQPADLDWRALQLFNQTTLDFEDCLLLAHHQLYQTNLATFDQGMLKFIG